MDSNRRPLVSEATALPIEPHPLPKKYLLVMTVFEQQTFDVRLVFYVHQILAVKEISISIYSLRYWLCLGDRLILGKTLSKGGYARALENLGNGQCDQMARIFFVIWLLPKAQILPNFIIFSQKLVQNFAQTLNKPTKVCLRL